MSPDALTVTWNNSDLQSRVSTHFHYDHVYQPQRYTSREFAALEHDKLWSKTWLVAAHTTDIPQPGDYVEFVTAGESMLVVRQTDGTVQAISNVCRHRATCLRTGAGSAAEFRCPFHGWKYGLDGALKEIPNDWDFPGRGGDNLPAFQTRIWNDFVFVSLAEKPEPFDEFLGPLGHDLDRFEMSSRYRRAAFRLVLPCNWKVAAASFPENYHVPWTHPQISGYASDVDITTTMLGRHGRLTNPRRPSPNLAVQPDDETYVEEVLEFSGSEAIDRALASLADGKSAREAVADITRQDLTDKGYDVSDVSVADLIDGIGYWIYPNLVAWVGFGSPGHVMRFFPNGDDPDTCIMEFWLMSFRDKTTETVPNVPVLAFEAGTSIVDALTPHLGPENILGTVFDQDTSNLAALQRGIHSRFFRGISYGRYQESVLRNFEEALDRDLGMGSGRP